MRTILVIKDEPQIASLVRDYLEHAGFAVLTASDGSGGLASPARAGPTRSSSTSACRGSTASTSSAPCVATPPCRS